MSDMGKGDVYYLISMAFKGKPDSLQSKTKLLRGQKQLQQGPTVSPNCPTKLQ